MTEPKKSFIRKTGGFLLGYLTPWRSISRSAGSVSKSMNNIADAARAAREAAKQQHERIQAAKRVQLTPEERRMTPAQLFDHYFEIHGWTEDGLKNNRTAFRRAKWACMFVALVSLVSGLIMLTVSHPILAFVIAPLLMICSLIIGSRGALEAWKQAQIELREVFNFKHFASRGDFFRRLVA